MTIWCIAAFTFDGPAQAIIEDVTNPRVRVHMAHIRPDVNPSMTGLLKEQPGSQLFTVFGQPRTRLEGPDRNGEYRVVMEGRRYLQPCGQHRNAHGSRQGRSVVHRWRLRRAHVLHHAGIFPGSTAWDKLSRALKGIIDPERFTALSGTVSLPFLCREAQDGCRQGD